MFIFIILIGLIGLVASLIGIYIGILMLFDPSLFFSEKIFIMSGPMFFFGAKLVSGVIRLANGTRKKLNGTSSKLIFISALLDILFGTVVGLGYGYMGVDNASSNALKLMPVVAVIYTVIMGIIRVINFRNFKAQRGLKIRKLWVVLISAVLIIAIAALVYLNPPDRLKLIWTGIFLIVEGVLSIVSVVF